VWCGELDIAAAPAATSATAKHVLLMSVMAMMTMKDMAKAVMRGCTAMKGDARLTLRHANAV
jgi:hypothetical protein